VFTKLERENFFVAVSKGAFCCPVPQNRAFLNKFKQREQIYHLQL